MTLRLVTVALVLGGLLTGCGKHYWQAEKRGVVEFRADSGLCIPEAKTKYGVSERIYRGCMRAHGWERVQTQYPSDLQFRGPEDEDEFSSPPDPLSARGPQQPEKPGVTSRPVPDSPGVKPPSGETIDCRNMAASPRPESVPAVTESC